MKASRDPESCIEIVKYNLMMEWRRIIGNPRLCLNDLNSAERFLFSEGLEDVFSDDERFKKMSNNPFEENVDGILLSMGYFCNEE